MPLSSRTAALLAALVVAPPVAAHHDTLPDPAPRATDVPLPTGLALDPGSVTVSGLSSGGFFAHQFHVAHSGIVTGAAIVAGGPYGCVEIIPNPWWPFSSLNPLAAALVACTHYVGDRFWGLRPKPPRAADAQALAAADFAAGRIDDPALLADDRVWLMRGALDSVVPAAVGESLAALYRGFGIAPDALQVAAGDPARPANHGMPVERFRGESRFPPRPCNAHAPPYVIECGYDAAERLLAHLLAAPLAPPVDQHAAGRLIAFDQTDFFMPSDRIGLSGVGYLYLPDACATATCRLHVAFHGCRQYADDQGEARVHDDFVRDAGYNRWAAANRIAVLYPQATATDDNPNGCWDFWGYSGPDWRRADGPQMGAVRAMIDALVAD
jgi:poly(3-hydroxybutyrate) depolymerase